MAECCARSATISFQRNEKLPGYVAGSPVCVLPELILILHPKADLWSVVSLRSNDLLSLGNGSQREKKRPMRDKRVFNI